MSSYKDESRGYKTRGTSYKNRYVEKECPECGNMKAYRDPWKTRIAFTCTRRSCRHKWYEKVDFSHT